MHTGTEPTLLSFQTGLLMRTTLQFLHCLQLLHCSSIDVYKRQRYGDHIELAFDPHKIHVFDKETELTITNRSLIHI